MIPAPWASALAVGLAVATWAGALALSGRPRLSLAVSVLGAVALGLVFAGWHVDDAGIVYAFARALADGRGLAPAAGLAPVEGFRDPLWVAVLAGFSALGVDPGLAAKAAQLALAAGTVLGVGAVAARAGAGPRGIAVAGAAVATSGVWVVWGASGLETGLFGWILVSVAAVAGEAAGAARRWAPLGALAALVAAAAWTRPEGAAAGVAVAAAAGLVVGGAWRAVLVATVAGAVVGTAALFALRFAWLGVWLPTTAVAKLPEPALWTVARGLLYAVVGLGWTGWAAWGAGALARGPTRAPVVAASAIIGVAATFAVIASGDWMGHARLFAPYVPVVLAWLAPAVVAGAGRPRMAAALGVTGAALGLGALAHAAWAPTPPIDHGLRRGGLYAALGASACGRATVATPDIGGVLYGWPAVEVTDLVGLVDAEAASHRRHPGYWSARIGVQRPALVDLHGGWARRTGLSDDVLVGLGYRIACRRGPAPTDPTIWIDARCTGAPSAQAARLLAVWCERGSGVPW